MTHDSSKNVVDESLLTACRENDPDSQQRLYSMCERRVHSVLARMVGHDDVLDLKQQVFVKAFSHLDRFSGKARFETWLYRIAINEALQFLRRRKNEISTVSTGHIDKIAAKPTDDYLSELLQHALKEIEVGLRIVFVLREIEGLSYREIAQVIGVPEGTVASRMNRARRELQKQLSELGWRSR